MVFFFVIIFFRYFLFDKVRRQDSLQQAGEVAKIIKSLLVIISFLALTTFAVAQGKYEQYMSAGGSALDKKDYGAAEEAFRAALKEKPEDYQATLSLGIVLNRQGQKEAADLLKKALAVNPQDPKTNLNMGIYYFDRSVYPEAKDYFETTIELAPNTGYSSEAKSYLDRMTRTAVKEKPWRVDAALGMQYDSNVIVGPNNQPTPEGISGKSDWRGVLYLKGQYDVLTSDRFRGTVSYSAYQSLHTRLSDFNITQQTAGVDALYALSGGVALKASYAFDYVLVGGDEYDYMHTVAPAVVFTYGKGFITTLNYVYSNFHFKNGDLFPDNSDRTGFNHSAGITQLIPVADFLALKAGYAFDKDNTKKDFWSYNGNKYFGNLTVKLMRSLSADLYGEYCNRNYTGVFPGPSVQRRDDIQTYSLTVTKGLSKNFSLVLGQFYVRNKSSITAFDYKRAITSMFITARF